VNRGTPARPVRVLVLEDSADDAALVVRELRRHGFEPDWWRAATRAEYEDGLERGPDVILADYTLPQFDALQALRILKERELNVPFLIVTGTIGEERAVQCMREGASDYLLKDRLARLGAAVTRALEEKELREQKVQAEKALQKLMERLEVENEYLQEEINRAVHFQELVGRSPALERVREQIRQVAPTDATVLILGETGTGKELIARAVHRESSRPRRPLVKVNCASLPATLIESELFGHERGAFTGAVSQHQGRFEVADGGTLFLDEVGEVPLELQAKLLRVLQDGEFERVGSSRTLRVDTRVIAATNRDLLAAIAAGEFRQDLYYRLHVFPITAPPLRERKEDIPLLAVFFVAQFARKLGRPVPGIPDGAMRALIRYSWPGNVRELENVLERAVILTKGATLAFDDVRLDEDAGGAAKGDTLAAMERRHIEQVLEKTGWRVAGKGGAAEKLGLKPSTLRSRMERLGVQRSPG
jgi:DNA-binding NtrC family response regulator